LNEAKAQPVVDRLAMIEIWLKMWLVGGTVW
jgi:hypothetical protein